MLVAVVDIGTNSTRLLVAAVDGDGRLEELERRSVVTRLGEGVDAAGALGEPAMGRVLAALGDFRPLIDRHEPARAVAVLTSAVRDAANGASFTRRVRDEFGLDARVIDGHAEARLTFIGATGERPADAIAPVVVVDIGGGSTEFVVGDRGDVRFHTSTQAGVVRHSERHLHHDPPTPQELAALREDVRALFAEAVPTDVRAATRAAVAVAGTATSLGAIDLAVEPYDPTRVHGHALARDRVAEQLDELAAMTEDERRRVRGLHPARAPTIVAGSAFLIEALDVFGLDAVEVSDHDILRGAAEKAVQRDDWTA